MQVELKNKNLLIATIEIDPEDLPLITQHQGNFYWSNKTINVRTPTYNRTLKHQILAPEIQGVIQIVHIDGDHYNFRRSNLRFVRTFSVVPKTEFERFVENLKANKVTPNQPTGQDTTHLYGKVVNGKFYSHEWLRQKAQQAQASTSINSGCAPEEPTDDIEF